MPTQVFTETNGNLTNKNIIVINIWGSKWKYIIQKQEKCFNIIRTQLNIVASKNLCRSEKHSYMRSQVAVNQARYLRHTGKRRNIVTNHDAVRIQRSFRLEYGYRI